MRISILIFSLFLTSVAIGQRGSYTDIGISKEKAVRIINKVRAKGCKCGNQYFDSAQSLSWNDKLVESAYLQTKMMKRYNVFAHIGPDGRDVADKMEMVGYNWHFAGENLGEGQDTFYEVLEDWIASDTHCALLMDPRMEEMGLVKNGKYWVLHLGKEMPENARRVAERYREN